MRTSLYKKIIFAVIVAAVFILGFIFLWQKFIAERNGLQAEQQTLAAAGKLLPEGSSPIDKGKISGNFFWYLLEPTANSYQIWVVNSEKKEAKVIFERVLSFISGAAVKTSQESPGVFHIRFNEAEAETPQILFDLYIDESDGSLLAETMWDGQAIEVATGSGVERKSYTLRLAPLEACRDNVTGPPLKVNVTGLLVNGVEYFLKQSHEVECVPNEFFNQGFYPTLGQPRYLVEAGEVRFKLPWGDEVAVSTLDIFMNRFEIEKSVKIISTK